MWQSRQMLELMKEKDKGARIFFLFVLILSSISLLIQMRQLSYFLPETTVWSYRIVLMMNLFLANIQLFSSQSHELMDWSRVDYCDVFISCLDSHSDFTHSLQSIHWWATDVMLHFSKSDEETNSSTSWMAWVWVYFSHFQQHFSLGF